MAALLACHAIAAEASENEHSWFLSDLGKHSEVKHLRAAAFADSNLGLLRITHARMIGLCDRLRCTKTVSQHEKQKRVLRIESSHDGSTPAAEAGLTPTHGSIREYISGMREQGFQMATSAQPYNFKCPNLACGAEYVAVKRAQKPQLAPRCIQCATPFLARERGQHIHYEQTLPGVTGGEA